MVNKIVEIALDQIIPNPYQPIELIFRRKYALGESISQNGILQPFSVLKKDGFYKLIRGESHLRASKNRGTTVFPFIAFDAKSPVPIFY